MGLSEDLKIVISGDPSKFNKALATVEADTKRLQATLSATAKISGAAFLGLTATVYGLVKAFEEDEAAQKQVEATLISTGRAAQFTGEELGRMATKLQDLTTFSDASVQAAQQIILTFDQVGRTKENFEEVTAASLDLAQRLGGDTAGAARILGTALQSPIDGIGKLRKAGVLFTDEQERQIKALSASGRAAEAQAIILAQVTQSTGGAAQAAAKGTGAFIQLQNTFSNIASTLGSQLSPFLETAANGLNKILKAARENPELLKTAAAFIGIATAVTGLVFGISTVGIGMLKFINIVKAAQIAFAGFNLTLAGVAGAAGIGLLLFALTDLAVNFDTRVKQMKAIWQGWSTFIIQASEGVAMVLKGAFSLDPDAIQAGLEKIKAGFNQASNDIATGFATINEERRMASVAAAEEEVQINADKNNRIYQQNLEFIERDKALKDANKALAAEAAFTDTQVELLAKQDFENQKLAIENQARMDAANAANIVSLDKLAKDKKEKALLMQEEVKYGKDLAKARALFRSEEVKATTDTLTTLESLSSSNSKTLFRLGKAAAIANAIVNTAQGVTKSLSEYPFPFNVAAAAATAAAGAVQISTIRATGMAEGGIVTGGVAGRDSVPIMGMPGELMVPTKNFDEVVNAVAAQRASGSESGDSGSSSGGTMEVVIGFTEDAFQIIEQKLIRRRAIGVGNL